MLLVRCFILCHHCCCIVFCITATYWTGLEQFVVYSRTKITCKKMTRWKSRERWDEGTFLVPWKRFFGLKVLSTLGGNTAYVNGTVHGIDLDPLRHLSPSSSSPKEVLWKYYSINVPFHRLHLLKIGFVADILSLWLSPWQPLDPNRVELPCLRPFTPLHPIQISQSSVIQTESQGNL